jgi:hypothetical protein
VGKPFGNEPFGRTNRSWEDNNMLDLGEIGCQDEEFYEVAELYKLLIH